MEGVSKAGPQRPCGVAASDQVTAQRPVDDGGRRHRHLYDQRRLAQRGHTGRNPADGDLNAEMQRRAYGETQTRSSLRNEGP